MHPIYILNLTFASVAGAYCLLGYWLAFGKQPWMWRAGTVCAALAMLVPIRAYEPLVFFTLTTLFFLSAAGSKWLLLFWRQRRRTSGSLSLKSTDDQSPSEQPRFQFRLHDLLVLMAVVGAAAFMFRVLLREQVLIPWIGTLISAVVAVAMTLALVGVLKGPRRIVSGVILVLVTGGSAAYFHWLHRLGPLGPGVQYFIGQDLGDQLFWGAFNPGGNLLTLLFAFLVFLGVFFGAARAIKPSEKRPWRRRGWQSFGVAAWAAWLFPMGWLYLQMLSFPQAPAQIHSRPNVLPLLLERGQALENLTGTQAQTVSSEVIELSKQPGFVAVPWEADLRGRKTFDQTYLDDIQTARSISRGLDAQATILETADPNLAVDPLLACLRLGSMLQHEGFMVHGLVGYAIDGTGEAHLIRLRHEFSVPKIQEMIALIESLESSRDDGDVLRDKLWYSLNDRWAFRLDQVLHAAQENGGNSSYYYYGLGNKRARCITRLLLIDLALRLYRGEHGEYPPKLELLAPKYLRLVPSDPLGEREFVYRPAGKEFVLYSVGGDGVDNGGVFGPPAVIPGQWDGYDLNLDAPQ